MTDSFVVNIILAPRYYYVQASDKLSSVRKEALRHRMSEGSVVYLNNKWFDFANVSLYTLSGMTLL